MFKNIKLFSHEHLLFLHYQNLESEVKDNLVK